MIRFLDRLTWKKGIIFTVFFIAMYSIINFSPIGVSGLAELTDEVSILDLEIGYSPEYAYEVLDQLGEEGRHFYLFKIIPLDFLFPLSYMLFFSVWTIFVFQKIFPVDHIVQKVFWIPVLTAVFDYFENAMIIVMLTQYPKVMFEIAYIANIFTLIKFALFSCSILVLNIGIIIFVIKKIFIQNRRTSNASK